MDGSVTPSPVEYSPEVTPEVATSEDYDAAKQTCLTEPTNEFLAAISCIGSAYRSPMVADSVLRDAARHVAEVAKRKAESRINEAFSEILGN